MFTKIISFEGICYLLVLAGCDNIKDLTETTQM